MIQFIRSILFFSLLSLILGCGFQLRGVGSELPEKFKHTSLILERNDNYLYSQVNRLINVNGGQVVLPEEAQIEVRLSPISAKSRQVALSGDGSIKEYERTYSLTITVLDSKSRIQYGQRTVSTTRNLQLDDRQILGGEEQQEVTLRAATKELAQSTVHYLSSLE